MASDRESGNHPHGAMNSANFALASVALANALAVALRELSEAMPQSDDEWLEDIRSVAIRDAKNAAVEGLPLEEEVEAIQFGVDVVGSVFDSALAERLQRRGRSIDPGR